MARKSTRNAQGGGTIRCRPDGRWEARFTVGKDPGTGKQIQRSVYGNTQKEVRQKLQTVCKELDQGVYLEPAKLTVKEWAEIWLKEYTSGLKPLTLKSYRTHVRTHIIPALGMVKLTALNTPMLQKFYNELQKPIPKGKNLAAKTIKNLHGVVHELLQQGVEIGYLRFNPSDACKLPRVKKAEIRPLEEEEITSFLKEIQGHQYELLYKVDLFTGMRQGEVLGLTWECVDFQKGTILVEKQLQKADGVYGLASLKNDKSRLITPAPFVMSLLKKQKALQARWQLVAGRAWENEWNLVFTNQLGGHLAHVNVYKNLKRIFNKMGLPKVRFHDLRHSYAVISLQSGDDIKTVQENMGHHTAAFTLDVYGHVSEKMKQDSADRMERFIQGIVE